ncbi:MAG: 23S rRNA (guanosine(2251)-2'-O)-methyltransferase RlmB [Pseudomonadota bacterium]
MSHDIFVAGLHAVESVLRNYPGNILELQLDAKRQDARLKRLIELAGEKNVRISYAGRDALDHLAGHTRHQGAIAICKQLPSYNEGDLPFLLEAVDGPPLVLILDGVTDPHNLGACLRTADAAGVHVVVAPRDKAAGINPTVRKVACGAAETVPFVQVTNLARTLRELQQLGIWLVGTSGEAEQSIYAADLKGPLGLVMGAEGKGMRRLTREHCDLLVSIPLLGSVESLNVSVATGVCLYEIVRQRGLA